VIEPSITYPLINTYFSDREIQPLESILSTLRCAALGLKKHFPCAILHSSSLLGGLGLFNAKQKATIERLNYFLYNIRRKSSISAKLEISIIYTQLEIGSFINFFMLPFNQYDHLATKSLCKQIWGETEPSGITVRPAPTITWVPCPLSQQDIALMDLATNNYNSKGSTMINKCRIHLQAISMMDLLTYDLFCIHPSYIAGHRPPSRQSRIYWTEFSSPQKITGNCGAIFYILLSGYILQSPNYHRTSPNRPDTT
jgi:hypothetical protein